MGVFLGKLVVAAANEKLLTKMVVWGMDKLAKKTTNKVDDAFVNNVKAEMRKRDLPAADFIKTGVK